MVGFFLFVFLLFVYFVDVVFGLVWFLVLVFICLFVQAQIAKGGNNCLIDYL